MKAIIEIDMDNAAFEVNPDTEVCRILRNLCDVIENDGTDNYALFDSNGNQVGIYRVGNFPVTPNPKGFKG